MFGGYTLVLILTASLIFIQVTITFGNSDDGEQVRKLATNNPTAGFISIDCGADGDRYDDTTGLIFKSDKEFIDTGVNMPISPNSLITTDLRQELMDLRSFPQGTKNCYTLKPQQGKNNTYLIRAFFYYGNYDGKSQHPTFDLYLGVNKWDTINYRDAEYSEIIHFSLTDIIYVCLVNTGNGIPYISSLELRLLNNSIYRPGSDAIATLLRYDVGGANSHRYPDDIYDRIWDINTLDFYYNRHQISTLSTIDILNSNDAYYPPAAVMRTAAMMHNASTPLSYSWTPLDTTISCYVYFHFAEIENLPSSQKRELNISFNEEYFLTQPIQLEYLKPLTVGPPTLPIITTEFTFSIYGTNNDSNLPPILNAFEVFQQIMLPASPTNIEDVDAIMNIKQVYGVSRNWQGDPCVPMAYSWDGLNCSYDNPPRIISLNLASSGLTGEIASSLSILTSIQSLDLSNNGLTGPVPEFLSQLPYLKTLNLTGNKLSGSIPQAMMEKVKNGSLNLSANENPNLCATESCLAKKKNKVGVLVASIVPVLLLFLLTALGIVWYHIRGRRPAGSFKSKNQVFTYSQIESITGNFSRDSFIGEGGFGKVYRGTLENGTQVAVKVLSEKAWEGQTQFQNEVLLLTRVHHKNLVSLLGYCYEVRHKALVYEYMANGNLRQHLSAEANANSSIWLPRLQIAIDAAQGLKYLHDDCKPSILHMDIKTSNILLNEKCQAKIADFGLSRDFKNEGGTLESAVPVGTLGYIDPEYEKNKKFSKKSDVYSFGIVLFELITGHPAILKDGVNSIHIPEWVKLRQGIKKIVDTKFGEYFDNESATKAVEIAWSCVEPTADKRPDMRFVVEELEKCLALERSGSQKNLG